MSNHYVVKNGQIERKNPFCLGCGEDVFMADKGGWWSCGRCGGRYTKSAFLFVKRVESDV